MKLSLNQQIAAASFLGILLGFILNRTGADHPTSVAILYSCDIIGKGVFLNLLKMLLIPLVFTSITVGIANLRAHAQMDKVWKLSLLYYFSTTGLAILLGLCVVNIFRPGAGLNIEMFQNAMHESSQLAQSYSLPEFFKNFIFNLFLNPIEAMAKGQILPTIMFAIFLGICLVKEGDRAKTILNFFNEFFNIIMVIVGWVMKILPVGLFALLTSLVASQEAALLLSLGKFMLVVIGVTLLHGFGTLPLILKIVTKRSPREFFTGMKDALITAFSTSSSSATLPITMRCANDNLKIQKDVSGFVLPLGATINMDGTALYEAVAAIFVANLVGIDLNIVQQLVVFFTAMIAAVGAPGIPSAGLVTMMMVLQSVGLPVEAIAILLPIDRLLDAVRTMVNVEGDAVGACVVDHLTKTS